MEAVDGREKCGEQGDMRGEAEGVLLPIGGKMIRPERAVEIIENL